MNRRQTPCLPLYAKGECRGCGAVLPRRKDGSLHKTRAWCSPRCADGVTRQHLWTWAREAAIRRNETKHGQLQCDRCATPAHKIGWKVEVNHIEPLRGAYRAWSCLNHEENLEVLCRPCHVEVTRAQRLEQRRMKCPTQTRSRTAQGVGAVPG